MDPSHKAAYEKHGYVIVPGLIPADARPALAAAAARAVARTRTGAWPHRRTVGSQFPPYDPAQPDAWGVQHVMHPALGEPAFARWYTSDALVGAVRALLGCAEDELQMELFNMLINPEEHEFALRWHRDDVRESASEEEEREALGKWQHGVQWNTALYDDACLFVVPGSHAHPRTPAQRAHSSSMAAPANPLDMPGAVRVALKAGDTVFYNSNILHCAAYRPDAPRATLHASMGCTRGGTARARNVLQHGLDWMAAPAFARTLDARGRAMLARLGALRAGAGDVGYSLANA